MPKSDGIRQLLRYRLRKRRQPLNYLLQNIYITTTLARFGCVYIHIHLGRKVPRQEIKVFVQRT